MSCGETRFDEFGAEQVDAAVKRLRASKRQFRLLVVEDNPTNQLAVGMMLEKVGIRPVVASNGREAIAALRKQSFDCVLMDLLMPEMGGIEATHAIRRLPGEAATVPIVALTANGQAEQVDACQEAGMNGYLSKPVCAENLYLCLSGFLDSWDDWQLPSMQEETPAQEAPAIDRAQLERFRTANGENMHDLLVKTFLNDATTRLKRLAEIMTDAAAHEEAVRTAHSLKSSAAMVGAVALSQLAAQIESDLDEGRKPAADALGRLNALFKDYSDDLRERAQAVA